jgi:hypothetical protein
MIYAILCIMLPRNPGDKPALRLHGTTFETAEERDREQTTLRHQNLPFSMVAFDFRDPREPEVSAGRTHRAFEAMQEFCDRVDRGEVRSKRTYAKFKAILAEPSDPNYAPGEAAEQVAEHAFLAGYAAAANRAVAFHPTKLTQWSEHQHEAWGKYDPPEDIKALL